MNIKKTIAFLAIAMAVAFVASVGLGVSAVCAGTWVTNPDPNSEASVTGDTITLGIANAEEGDHQDMAVHGATLELPPAEEIYVEYDCDLASWDSYNPVSGPGTGYWDLFSISVSQDKYWALALSDPINDGNDPLSLGFSWGGTKYGDGILETTSGIAATTMTASTASTNYLNVVLDTATAPDHNGSYPSWGTCEITNVEILGVPSVTKELVDAWPVTGNGDNIIDLGEKWYFNLSITVTNNIILPIDNVMVKDNLGGDLELNDSGVSVGTFNSWTTGKTEKVHLTWEDIGTLIPGQTETMWLLVSTDINTGTGNGKKLGHQEYTSEGTHCLNSGATAKGSVDVEGVVWGVSDTTEEICVTVGENPIP